MKKARAKKFKVRMFYRLQNLFWGFLSGGFWLGGFCPGGFCRGVYVRGVFVRGGFVLIPRTTIFGVSGQRLLNYCRLRRYFGQYVGMGMGNLIK